MGVIGADRVRDLPPRGTPRGPSRPGDVVLAVDGGGSKTDVLAVALDGSVVAHARGAGSNPQVRGWDVVQPLLDELRSSVLRRIDGRRVVTTHVYLAGLDLPDELLTAREVLAHWGDDDAGAPDVLDNDLFALLRAGTLSADAAVVVCGTGINALAVRGDGRTARFPALGDISGDWGGGADLGNQALWHAARAEDGRGPATLLTDLVPAAVGLRTVREVIEAIHYGRLDRRVQNRFSPVLFHAAAAGDDVAARVVARQADEVVLLASAALGRLALGTDAARPVPVVLGGGVLAARHPQLDEGIVTGLQRRVPGAVATWVTAPPVLGAGQAALEAAGASREALAVFGRALGRLDGHLPGTVAPASSPARAAPAPPVKA